MASKTFQFPVYQIDFSAVASGKHIAASKRRIRWYVINRIIRYCFLVFWLPVVYVVAVVASCWTRKRSGRGIVSVLLDAGVTELPLLRLVLLDGESTIYLTGRVGISCVFPGPLTFFRACLFFSVQ